MSPTLNLVPQLKENIWRGKFWQTIQVKTIGEENFGE